METDIKRELRSYVAGDLVMYNMGSYNAPHIITPKDLKTGVIFDSQGGAHNLLDCLPACMMLSL